MPINPLDEDVIDTMCEITTEIHKHLSLESKVKLAKQVDPKMLDEILEDAKTNIEALIEHTSWYGIWTIIQKVLKKRWKAKNDA